VSRRARNPRGAGDRLREELVAAAGRLLDEGGDAALTLRAAARAVGAAPQSVYLHFAGREQLLWAVLEERFAELAAALRGAGGDDHVARLRACCLAFCAFGTAHPRRYRSLLDRAAPVAHDVPLDALPGAATYRILEAAVRDALPDDASPFPATTDLLATLHGAVMLRTGTPSFPWPPIEDVVDRAIGRLVAPGSSVGGPPR
jgi:AcrR family transcriptional regulator